MENYDLSLEDVPEQAGLSNPESFEGAGQSANEASQEPSLFEYQANGKTIKEDLDTILKRASAGYNYAQLVNEHKNNVGSFEREREEHLSKFGQWKQYHDYAEQNPAWADYVRTQWEQREMAGQPSGFTQDQIEAQPTQIDPEVRRFMEEYRQDKALQQQAVEDENLNREISDFKSSFPEIDLSYVDPATGASVEMKILDHARANKIESFKAAAKDFLFDDIINKRVTAAKEAAAKELAARTKSGVVDKSASPFSGITQQKRRAPASYHDLAMEGARELGIF